MLILILGITWARIYGWKLAGVLTLLRTLWVLPFGLVLWPERQDTAVISKPPQLTIAVFIDDSTSMAATTSPLSPSALTRAEAAAAELTAACAELGCGVMVSRGSMIDRRFTKGLSPLSSALQQFFDSPAHIFVVFTDGGAMRPELMATPWMHAQGRAHQAATPGRLTLMVRPDQEPAAPNIALASLRSDPFGFTTTHHSLSVQVHRSQQDATSKVIQLNLNIDGKTVAAANVHFEPHRSTTTATLRLPLLEAGHYLISVRALAIPGERESWDNTVTTSVEILPHSSGVLHLLGSPNSDGRFLRRFLKLDPRFETLSFFILRDPWDFTTQDERAVSLIPFPVDSLFTDELPHFKVVVMQNFRMSQFLQSSHGRQLVDYVLEGGSLMFIGGPRALHFTDTHYSALTELLPYDTPPPAMITQDPAQFADEADNTAPHPELPWYDTGLTYKLSATATSQLAPAAALSGDIHRLKAHLEGLELTGIHRSENLTFRTSGYLPLISATATSPDAPTSPLPFLSASFKGKGRILWLFSDALWQLAMHPTLPRDVYNTLLTAMMRWLTRDQKTPPLTIEALELTATALGIEMTARVYGSGVPYLTAPGVTFELTVCGQPITDPTVTYLSTQAVMIASSTETLTTPGQATRSHCNVQLRASHEDLGQETARAIAPITYPQTDVTLATSATVWQRITTALGARAIPTAELIPTVRAQVRNLMNTPGLTAPLTTRQTTSYHYHALDSWWILLLFAAIPLEVWVRRSLSHQGE